MSGNTEFRLRSHPILTIEDRPAVNFAFDGQPVQGRAGEMITTSLFANGIRIFGHHESDGAPQGIFCVNGQCSQCMVIADGMPVKGCMTPVAEGMDVRSCNAAPELPLDEPRPKFSGTKTRTVDVLIVGGGPSGLTAADELGALGIGTLLIDDKARLGGKLTLQTHNFFGSIEDCYAGMRGMDIAEVLAADIRKHESVETWLSAAAVGVYADKKVGILRGDEYILVEPKVLIVAAGAREKSLAFPGCDLPGVYGAGAFQTLVNRDFIKPTDRLFIVGGGNVGLIAAYHALQAGIEVVGLVEALPSVGGYKVHQDKIKRLGVPIWTSHTVLRAEGADGVQRVTIAAVDERFSPVAGTERSFDIDTLLIAVGLNPIDELLITAEKYGMCTLAAGDSHEIAEASAAIFSGRIIGREAAKQLGHDVEIPDQWHQTAEVLRAKPGDTVALPEAAPQDLDKFPVFRCDQEIPCNPCTEVCPVNQIKIPGDSMLGIPEFVGEQCTGCGKCVIICPGLAISVVVGSDPDRQTANVMLPWELPLGDLAKGVEVETVDADGDVVGRGTVTKIKLFKSADRRHLFWIDVPYDDRLRVAAFRPMAGERQDQQGMAEAAHYAVTLPGDDPIICRCMRVRKSEIIAEIRAGVRDMNQLKASIRTSMGSCGGKTCTDLILRLFREEGVDLADVTLPTTRPLDTEVPLGIFAGIKEVDA
ncbi:MAG: FAD-dependent oxidoreductase [Phycisphaerales bacterium]|nr:FAD-dependent oxidoreductase [Phycisphaerales bacterium]